MILMNLNILNFIHNFNFNNTVIFNTCSFHHYFFHEQNIIFHHCIFFYSFCLTAQNNFVIIDLNHFYKNTLESNYNIFNIFTNHGIKDFFFAFNVKKMLKKFIQMSTCSKTKLPNLIYSLEIIFILTNK